MPSSIVIKVKFKKTMRRFIATIADKDEKLAIDVVTLEEKIRGFFNFDSNVEFTMTYVDEDGDKITLVDDDDLVDIVQQSLDPLRITVKLNNSDPGVSSQTSSSLQSGLTQSKLNAGARCNFCGVITSTADWFMPKLKNNYNLCRSCIYGTGNIFPFTKPVDPFLHIPPPPIPQALKNYTYDVFGSALNSGLILDVNIPDGTVMAPSTNFTKVWRMWNIGPNVWPQGTQLQWVSGDRLTSSDSVNVEIPHFGLSVGKELDIKVNFVAPERPGSYVSYWRMASPSGQTFGQQVRVMIKVENVSVEELVGNLTNSEVVEKQDPGNNSSKITDSDVTSVDSKPNDQKTYLPINDATRMKMFLESIPQSRLIPIPSVHSSEKPSAVAESAPPLSSTVPAVQPSGSSSQDIRTGRKQTLLEEMGFLKVDLIKDLLRRNNYDVKKSIDDLCYVSEWEWICR